MPWIAKYTFLLQILGRDLCKESRQAVSSNVNKLIGVAFPAQGLCSPFPSPPKKQPFSFLYSVAPSIRTVAALQERVSLTRAEKNSCWVLSILVSLPCSASWGSYGLCGFWGASEKPNPFPLLSCPVMLFPLLLASWTISLRGNHKCDVFLSVAY